MAKRLAREAAEAVLHGDDRRAIFAAIKTLPGDVDPPLAAKAVLNILNTGNRWAFARACRKLPEPVIRAVVAGLGEAVTPTAIFLRAYLSEPPTSEDWAKALNVLLDLDTSYAWGSKHRRAKLAALAKDPRVVAAIQTTVVGGKVASLDALAVLAIEGSDASVDALMPHFERAAKDQDRGLDRLQALRTHATMNTAMTAMLARVDALLGARHASSPALDLAREIGLGDLEVFWFWSLFGSIQTQARVPAFQANLHVDSRDADWFGVHVSGSGTGLQSPGTSFNLDVVYRDTLELGRCAPRELPGWLAAAAKKHGFAWDFERVDPRTHLRGKKRAHLIDWLRGG